MEIDTEWLKAHKDEHENGAELADAYMGEKMGDAGEDVPDELAAACEKLYE